MTIGRNITLSIGGVDMSTLVNATVIVRRLPRFYCELCGRRATFSKRRLYVWKWQDTELLQRRCKCGHGWAEAREIGPPKPASEAKP